MQRLSKTAFFLSKILTTNIRLQLK